MKTGYWILDIGNLIIYEYQKENDFAKFEMLRTLLHLLLLRAERSKDAYSNAEVKPYWFEIFNALKNLLERQSITTKNARHYAKQLLISYKFLNQIVKQLTNKTAKAYVDSLFFVIKYAQFLLIANCYFNPSTSLNLPHKKQ